MTTTKRRTPAPRKSPSRAAAPALTAPRPPRSMLAEHIHRIGILGKRIDAYIQFMTTIGMQSGLSDEVKTRAVSAFFEKLLIVEQQLGRVHDAYQLE